MLIKDEKLQNIPTGDVSRVLPAGNPLFFDIETTGLGWRSSHLYMIGVMFQQRETWILRQFFLDRPFAEKEFLQEFSSFLQGFPGHILVHFNGDTFDLPYLRAKYDFYNLPTPEQLLSESFDMLREIRPLKKMLCLTSLKQKTLETFLGLSREDRFSGRELIQVYQNYLKSASVDNLRTLFQHNRDDILGIAKLIPFLSLRALLSGNFRAEQGTMSKDMLHLRLELPCAYTGTLYGEHLLWSVRLQDKHLTASIPVKIGSLKYFYSNWKDYYYFPQEDKAIHKSVAVFADKAHREKASAETCFQRKPGCYIPVFGTSSMPLFFEEYHSSPAYIAVSETWLQDPMAIQEYCTGLFCSPEFRLIKKDPAQ